MNCKNCQTELPDSSKFCSECGAKVVKERLTIKKLWTDVSQGFFGWDNKYFLTIKDVLIQPRVVIQGYLNGVRKKHLSPFAFVAIGTAISMFIFTQFSDKFMEVTHTLQEQQFEIMTSAMKEEPDTSQDYQLARQEYLERADTMQRGLLKYFNIFTFLLLPVYSFMAFIVFRKPYNFAEHLVINSYIQGVSFILSMLLFVLSVYTSSTIYSLQILATILLYMYVYGKLYNYGILKLCWKLLQFFGIAVVFFILLVLVSLVIGLLAKLYFG